MGGVTSLPLSTTAARELCKCHKCGYPVYENLVHFCSTSATPRGRVTVT